MRGAQVERQARRFLIRQGLKHVQSNYRCRYGEIDLIMEDNGELVFVEVRYRNSERYGGALESITRKKQARLRATAEHYLQRLNPRDDRPCRFDVVLSGPAQATRCAWIRDAF